MSTETKKSQPNERWEAVREYLSGNPDVLLAYLYGSQATGKSGPTSDYDIGVLVKSPSAKLRDQLSYDLTGILKSDRIDLVFLNRAPAELAYAIISQGQLIYQHSLAMRVETEAQILSRYGDYLPILRAQQREILRVDRYEAGVQRYRTAFRRTERTLATLRTTQRQKAD